jgi:hypothetical protein
MAENQKCPKTFGASCPYQISTRSGKFIISGNVSASDHITVLVYSKLIIFLLLIQFLYYYYYQYLNLIIYIYIGILLGIVFVLYCV